MIQNTVLNPTTYKPIESDDLPVFNWDVSTPEEQGMDSEKLVAMVEFYKQKHSKNKNISIDSITIIRNEVIVADIYLNPLFPEDTPHIIHSCTKSVMSILIGIAIDKGYIDNVGVRVVDVFPDKQSDIMDERLQNLTLEDLLTMQTGLHSQDSYLYEWRGLFRMMDTDDWTKHILNLPMEAEPGQRFDYSNMSSFLLSAILTKMTGMDSLSFARRYLFEPLGIHDVRWGKSPQGIYIGWARLWLKPHDMAKLGLLYLNKGKWANRQIVSSEWVEQSLTAHSFPKKFRTIYQDNGRVDRVRSGASWFFTNLLRPFSEGYGYQWWLDKDGMFSAIGVGGQYIMVVPDANLIAVFTSKLSGADSFLPARMLKQFILPAIVSDAPIEAHEIAQHQLKLLSRPPRLDEHHKVVPAPSAEALAISKNTYSLEDNPWNYDNFQLVFDPDEDFAVFNYSAGDKHYSITVGMDGMYRWTRVHDERYAAKGSWTSPDTFVIDYEIIGYSSRGKWTLRFVQDEIFVDEVGVTGAYSYQGRKQTTL